jgi:hypothetical protein
MEYRVMRLWIVSVLLMVVSPASAQTLGSTSGASSMVQISSPATTTTHLITAPTIAAPGLAAAGIETCLGSTAGGISLMGGGLTFGSTKVDQGCTIRLLARQLFAFGFQKAALALMCQDERVAAAMSAASSPCPAPSPALGSPVAMLSADLPAASSVGGSQALSMMATDPLPTSSLGIGEPLSLIPVIQSTPPAESQGPVQVSFAPVQPFSQEEQAWFDRASNSN